MLLSSLLCDLIEIISLFCKILNRNQSSAYVSERNVLFSGVYQYYNSSMLNELQQSDVFCRVDRKEFITVVHAATSKNMKDVF